MSITMRFVTDKRGNFAIIAAFCAVPLVFATGAAIDSSRLATAKVQLQSAVDAAALSVVKTSGFDPAKANSIADRMIRSNYGDHFRALQIDFSGFGATISVETVVPTTLTGILGYREFTARVSGTVEYPQTKYEVVLVLDTTGSMAGAKLTEMKKAAADLVEQLSATPILRERVRFALVPFSTYVNVGANKANASWIDKKGSIRLPGSVIPSGSSRLDIFTKGFQQPWRGCVETRIEAVGETQSVDDTLPDAGEPRTLFMPMLAPDEPGNRRAYPNDYAKDGTLERIAADLKDGQLDSAAALPQQSYRFFPNVSELPGPNWGCDSRPIVPLTNEPETIKAEIAKLQAAGSTNITEGMAWANRVLSPGEPFTEGADQDADVEKIIVLLTDGDNSITRLNNDKGSTYSSYGYIADGRFDDSYKQMGGKACKNGDDDDDDDDDDEGGANLDGNCSPQKSGTEARRVSENQVLKAMNADTTEACNVAKDAASEVYTIRLEVATTTSSKVLSDCATDRDHYYDAKSASDLPAIFDAIAQRILRLKITS